MEFKGRIEKIFPVQTDKSASGNEWRRMDFIFEYFEHETDRYSDRVILPLLNDRIERYDIHEGDEVVIGFGHSVSKPRDGRQWNEMRVYKLEKLKSTSDPSQNLPPATSQGVGEQNIPLINPNDPPF